MNHNKKECSQMLGTHINLNMISDINDKNI